MDEHVSQSIRWIPSLPLLAGALGAAWLIFGRREWPRLLICSWHIGGPLAAFASSVWLTWDLATRFAPGERFLVDELGTWISAGDFHAGLTLRLDPLSAVCAMAVSAVAVLVHVYALGFSRRDPNGPDLQRLFSVSNLLLSAVLVLFLVDHPSVALLAWQTLALVGSGLVGFRSAREFHTAAAERFAVLQRVGDLALLLALLALFWTLGGQASPGLESLEIGPGSPPPAGSDLEAGSGELQGPVTAAREAAPSGAFTLVGFLLLASVAIKAQQLPFPEWRSGSVAPVPATAILQSLCLTLPPVYLLSRLSFVFENAPLAGSALAWCGAVTSLTAALAALYASDLRRAFAYSSVSHLGVALAAAGLGAYGAAVYYALGQTLIRPLLLLSGGSVILGLGGETRLDRMGGLLKSLPWTHVAFFSGSVLLLLLPLSAAGQVWVSQPPAGWFALAAVGGLAVAALTLHTTLLYLRMSTGRPSASPGARLNPSERESSLVFGMGGLAALALFMLWVAGLPDPVGAALGVERSNSLRHFLAPVFGANSGEFDSRVAAWAASCIALGFAAALLADGQRRRGRPSWVQRLTPLLGSAAKVQRLDSVATRLLVRPLLSFAHAVRRGVESGLYERGAEAGARLTRGLAQRLAKLSQNGLAQSYLVGSLIGAALLLVYVLRGA